MTRPGEGIPPGRDDEANGIVVASHRRAQRASALPECEIERCALERPAPVIDRSRHLRLALEQTELVQLAREQRECRAPGRIQARKPPVIFGGVCHVLAATFVTSAAQNDGRGHAGELRRDVDRAALGSRFFDVELEPPQPVPERHQPSVGSAGPLGSTLFRR